MTFPWHVNPDGASQLGSDEDACIVSCAGVSVEVERQEEHEANGDASDDIRRPGQRLEHGSAPCTIDGSVGSSLASAGPSAWHNLRLGGALWNFDQLPISSISFSAAARQCWMRA
jgi:hypothetical protein